MKRRDHATGTAAAAATSLPFSAEELRSRLSAWYAAHARALPWRNTRDPYAIWLSEIMLQQTRVAVVLQRYGPFLQTFPTLEALARAKEERVLAAWSGLGYYRRARMLHKGAQFVVRELQGKLPRTAAELRTLPGVGDYTGAAIASIAFGESVAALDGNVERVLLRLLGAPESGAAKGAHSAPALNKVALQRVAQLLVPKAASAGNPPGDHNQAMMELGATICLPRSPLCLQCPLMDICRTRGEHPTAARAVQNNRTVAHLLAVRKRGTRTEVLLQRRAAEASLMPGMLELPPLPLDAVEGREPVLRLGHSITNTRYTVHIYASGVAGVTPQAAGEPDEEMDGYDAVFRREAPASKPQRAQAEDALLRAVPAAAADLAWTDTHTLLQEPLTGLARKVLQRLGLMALPRLQIGTNFHALP